MKHTHADFSILTPAMTHTWYHKPGSMGQGLVIEENTGRNVAVAYDAKDSPLLAAAPEMYEALNLIHAAIVNGELKWTKPRRADSDPYHPANIAMSAALAKAEEI